MTTTAEEGPPRRICLHCALARALQIEMPSFDVRGLSVTLGHFQPVLLPVQGSQVYRTLRRLVHEARVAAERSPVKLAVVDLPGKTHVEVLATVHCGRGVRVFVRAFARHAVGTLEGGFAEGLLAG